MQQKKLVLLLPVNFIVKSLLYTGVHRPYKNMPCMLKKSQKSAESLNKKAQLIKLHMISKVKKKREDNIFPLCYSYIYISFLNHLKESTRIQVYVSSI